MEGELDVLIRGLELSEARTDLTRALENRFPLSVVRDIVQRCPGVLHKISNDPRWRFRPLLDALSHGADLQVVKFLVEQNPQLVWDEDTDGRSPTQLASEREAGDDVIRYLFDRRPDGAAVRWALKYGTSDDFTLHLVEHCPPEALRRRWGRCMSFFAHIAAERGVSLQVMRAVVEPYPEALHRVDCSGLRPLALAVVNSRRSHPSSAVAVVRYLYETFPEALEDENANGEPVFYLATAAGAPPDILSYLLQVRPQALKEKTKIGNLPVHVAARLETPEGFAAFQHLVELWPESIQLPDADGDLPLHCTILWYKGLESTSHESPSVPFIDRFRYILDKWPPAIRMKGYDKQIPLHLAICRGVPPDAMGILLDAWPESIHELTEDGASILHVVTNTYEVSRVSIETVEFLVGRDESILDARSAVDGSLAVHICAGEKSDERGWDASSLDFIRFLVGHRPESVMARDDKGCLPIHRAVANPDQHLNVVEYLVEQRPETLSEKNHRGSSPLHVAVAACTKGMEHVEFLVGQRPEALQEGDNGGNLPIHIAVSVKRPLPDLIRFLAEQDPDSLLVRNSMGLSPLHLVVVHAVPDRPSVEVARILVEHRPNVVTLGNFKDDLPVHLAAHRGDSCLDLVRFFVGERPDTVMTPSHGGWLPLRCAAASAKGAFEVVECPVGHGPGAAMVTTTDSTRRLPLHCILAGAGALSDVTKIALNAGKNEEDEDDLNEEEEEEKEEDDDNNIVKDNDDLNEEEEEEEEEEDDDDDDDDDENNDDNNNDNNNSDDNIYEDRETRLLELVRLLVDKAPDSLQVQDAHGMIPLAVAALNPTTPLDVLFFLTKSWPSCVHTMAKCSVPEGGVGITSAAPGPSHPLTKRRRRAYDDADKDAAAAP